MIPLDPESYSSENMRIFIRNDAFGRFWYDYLQPIVVFTIGSYFGTLEFLENLCSWRIPDSFYVSVGFWALFACSLSLILHATYWVLKSMCHWFMAFLKPCVWLMHCVWRMVFSPTISYLHVYVRYLFSSDFRKPITLPSSLVSRGGESLLRVSHGGQVLFVKMNPIISLLSGAKSFIGLECAMQNSPFMETKSVRSTLALCDSDGNFHGCMFRFRAAGVNYLATAYHVYQSLGRDGICFVSYGKIISFLNPKIVASSPSLDFIVFADSHQINFAGAKVAKGSMYEPLIRVTTHGSCDGYNWSTARGGSAPYEAPYFTHTASTGSGFSGSPLFNDKGLVVGMHLRSQLVDGIPKNVGLDLVHILVSLDRLSRQERLESFEPGDDSSAWYDRGEEIATKYFESGKGYSDLEYYGTAYEYMAREDKYALRVYFEENPSMDVFDADDMGVRAAFDDYHLSSGYNFHSGSYYKNENAQDFQQGLGTKVTQPLIPPSCSSHVRPACKSSLSSENISSSDLIPLFTPKPVACSVTLESATQPRVAPPMSIPVLPTTVSLKRRIGTGPIVTPPASSLPLPTKPRGLKSKDSNQARKSAKSRSRKQNTKSC